MDREDKIKARAQAIWEQEGRPEGRSADHWERAEREIDSQAAEQGGNEETGAALASTAAQSDAVASHAQHNASSAQDDARLQEGEEGSAQLHEDVTGSPKPQPLGKKKANRR
ncbi:DUF2934 domain-containing protein [Tianweitania sp. BSSL-BM11]|uniref:DUF2934 domain-containing protein n=1 Tax=Tianweitania aestuarii TaxID=2814886 RepID=A0ABS5RWH6_9HYPH|nr:DUF2934 domain-containing protein [Tianweitania aestuarii]MBS9720647.1 DUF2934 domain-containing protein [Tianweitania aestuarii]